MDYLDFLELRHSDDELAHKGGFKYIKRYMGKNGKWQYVYADSTTHKNIQLQKQFASENRKLQKEAEKDLLKQQQKASQAAIFNATNGVSNQSSRGIRIVRDDKNNVGYDRYFDGRHIGGTDATGEYYKMRTAEGTVKGYKEFADRQEESVRSAINNNLVRNTAVGKAAINTKSTAKNVAKTISGQKAQEKAYGLSAEVSGKQRAAATAKNKLNLDEKIGSVNKQTLKTDAYSKGVDAALDKTDKTKQAAYQNAVKNYESYSSATNRKIVEDSKIATKTATDYLGAKVRYDDAAKRAAKQPVTKVIKEAKQVVDKGKNFVSNLFKKKK